MFVGGGASDHSGHHTFFGLGRGITETHSFFGDNKGVVALVFKARW